MPTKPRCLIFNAAFPVLGGGERYTVALGTVIAETHLVTYAGPNQPLPDRVRQLGFPALDVMLLTEAEFPSVSSQYDVAVFITVDVPPRSFATKSLAIVQFPRGVLPTRNPIRRWMVRGKLRRYHCVVYSEFVRDWLQQRWRVAGEVLMPPVVLAEPRRTAKENLILSVGRFTGRMGDEWYDKRQDVLIEAFSQLPALLRDSWRLVLVGGYAPSPEMDAHIEQLRQRAAELNISIETNVAPERLAELQDRARLFWHAAGFERPPSQPEGVEHFGISTVEAMSHRAIPLVYAAGGQLEIVTPATGRLWRSVPELIEQTVTLMKASSAELDTMSDAARAASVRFGTARFNTEARDLLERLGTRGVAAGRVRRAVDTRRRRARVRIYRINARLYAAFARYASRLRA